MILSSIEVKQSSPIEAMMKIYIETISMKNILLLNLICFSVSDSFPSQAKPQNNLL